MTKTVESRKDEMIQDEAGEEEKIAGALALNRALAMA